MKNKFIPVLIAILFSAVSCEWTEYENLTYHKTPAELDPAGYENYLASIRAYKDTEHRVMLVTMLGTSEFPSRQNQHLTSMPDSADFILMKNAENLHPNIAAEIAEVYNKKGTKTLVYVDCAKIDEQWRAYEDAKLSENSGYSPADDEIKAFYKEKSKAQLDLCNLYGFHGIVVSYVGGADDIAFDSFLEPVNEWYPANSDKLMFLRGSVDNIGKRDKDFANECVYYIIPGGKETSPTPINSMIARNIGNDLPKDRAILELTVPSADNPKQEGYTPKDAAQDWLLPALGLDSEGNPTGVKPKKFPPCGLCVGNAHDDYFSKTIVYSRIRAGITALAN